MRWMRMAGGAAVIAAAMLLSSDVPAGTVPEATGTIYFQDLSTLDAATNTVVLYSMDGDGGNRTAVLRTDRYVRPSRVLHGSTSPGRWFLTMKEIEGAEVGGNPRRDVYAVRADGAEVRLTSDPTTEYWMPDWIPGENDQFAVVSMLGRRWASTAPDATVVPNTAGMYFSRLDFDEDGSIATVRGGSDPWGGLAFPSRTDPAIGGWFCDASVGDREGRDSVAYFSSLGGDTPDVAAYSWSPDASLIAVEDLDARSPRIRSAEFTGDTGWHGRWEGQDPDWETLPSGGFGDGRIAFGRLVRAEGVGTDTWVIETATAFDAGGRFTEASVPHPANASTTRSLSGPKFSPDRNHIAYQVQRNGTGTTFTIHRDEVGGNHPADLTHDVKNAAAGETGMILVAWR